MKFKARTKDLVDALQEVTAIINDRVVTPILKEVKFDLKGSSLCLTSSDTENALVRELGVEGGNDGSVCMDAKMLLSIIKTLSDPEVEITLEKKLVRLVSLAGVYEIPASDAKDYPNLPKIEDAKTITIDSTIIYEGVTKTIHGVARDTLRAFDYLLVTAQMNEIIFVGCDTNSLFEFKSVVDFDDSFSLLLGIKSANILKSYADGNGVELTYTPNYIMMKTAKSSIYCRLGEGKYVDYTVVIPKEADKYAVVDRASLISAIKRGLVLTNRSTSSIIVNFLSTGITIKSEDTDFKTSAKEEVGAEYVGEEMTICLNGKKVIDCLNGIDTEKVRVELELPSRPAVFRPEGESGYLGLTMPLNLKA